MFKRCGPEGAGLVFVPLLEQTHQCSVFAPRTRPQAYGSLSPSRSLVPGPTARAIKGVHPGHAPHTLWTSHRGIRMQMHIVFWNIE